MDRFIIWATQSPKGCEWWVWEYDLDKPLNLEAADRRRHYAAKKLHGVFKTEREAVAALPSP